MKYMVFDREHNPLACLLFGSSAWNRAPRDDLIGWNAPDREANLKFLTNNMRFLILPWVRVPRLASHILGRVAKRISSEWIEKYGHPLYLLSNLCGTATLSRHLLLLLPIGFMPVKPKVAAAMTAMPPLKCRSKIFTFTR